MPSSHGSQILQIRVQNISCGDRAAGWAFRHGGHVSYQGVAGRYYRAYVSIWGGGMTIGDNRYFYTSSKKAT